MRVASRWGTFLPNLGTLGLCVLELFAIDATDGQTHGQTDGQKQRLLPPFLRSEHKNRELKTARSYDASAAVFIRYPL